MWRALRALGVTPGEVLIDGRFALPLAVPCRAIVKGDANVPELMAASIIAKTARDRFMRRYARIEPAYYFHEHKGYATPCHRFLVRLHGAFGHSPSQLPDRLTTAASPDAVSVGAGNRESAASG